MMSIAAVAVCQVFVTSLPVLVLNARGVSGTAAPSLTLLDVAGIVLWIGAWGLQVCLSALHAVSVGCVALSFHPAFTVQLGSRSRW